MRGVSTLLYKLNCIQCGIEFQARTKGKKYCSPRCSRRRRNEKYFESHGILLTTENHNRRRAKGKCNTCGNNHEDGSVYCRKCRVHHKNRVNIRDKALRREILAHYGNQCTCCGEKRLEFLCMDHVYGLALGENKERGQAFYRRIKKAGFPGDLYRVLCHNCNISRGLYGYCPHDQEKPGQLSLYLVS